MRTLHTLLLLACFNLTLSAQFNISGSLVENNGAPISFANVLVLNPGDSSLAAAELSMDDGAFTVSADTGNYLLQITMLGMEDYWNGPFDLNANKNLGQITMEAAANILDAVEVKAKKPFLEQEAGKMIVNVENSLTGQNGSTMDLLKKVPGMLIVRDQISLAGQQNVKILIDGKPTRYMDINSLLKEMPASDIEKIEVISQPGAAYDAEGAGGVINIILKKNVLLGTNGSVRAGLGYGWAEKINGSVRLNHRSGPLNTYASISGRHSRGFERMLLDRKVGDLSYIADNFSPYAPNSGSIRGGIDYDVTETQTIGVSGRYSGGVNNPTDENETNVFDAENNEIFSILTTIPSDRMWQNYAAQTYYSNKLDTLGQKLDIDLSIAGYKSETTDDILTQVFGEVPSFGDRQNNALGNNFVAAAQLDYKKPLSKMINIETGVKYSYAEVDNTLNAFERSEAGNPWQVDMTRTNQYIYTENIYAGYVSANYTKDKFSVNAGLRYEHTLSEGYNVTIDSLNDLDYGSLFPSLGISGPLGKSLGWNGSYSYRINRPRYKSLNSFEYYLDPLTFERGNPNIRPEYIHTGKVGLTFDGQPFFSLEYQRTNGAIQLVTEQDDDTGQTFAYDRNFDHFTRYGGSLFFPLSFIPKTDGYGGVMAFYNEYESEYLGELFNQGAWNVVTFINAQVELPWELKGEVNFWWVSGGQEGLIRFDNMYGSNIGIQRKFLNDQLTIGLEWDDPAFKYWQGAINYQNMDLDIESQWDVREVSLNITYKFGNRYMKNRNNRKRASDDLERRAGGNN